jgi:hypothetical protein
MAANEALQPEQLKLFMTADEIKGRVNASPDQRSYESMPQLWDRKWRQSDMIHDTFDDEGEGTGPTLRESIATKGYQEQKPITLLHTDFDDAILPDAHHRVEVMSRLHPDQFLNVQHSSSMHNYTTTGRAMADYHEKKRKRDRET